MDVGALRGRIIATLDADADSRRRAELDLKTVSILWLPIEVLSDIWRPRTSLDSPMRFSIFCRLSRRTRFACRVGAL